ncbi:MAG: hypothetical protein JW932_15855 [Deltaproteobacteria bacterium]|nr:hypothetical protein [Deltaproteobacteria bacterium]
MKTDRRRVWWTLFLLIASGIAILAGYYLGTERGTEKKEAIVEEKGESTQAGQPPLTTREASSPNEGIQMEEIETPPAEKKAVEREDECALIDEQIKDFFVYLNGKDYIQQLEKGIDTYDRFKALIKYLSANLPVPSGERRDAEMMKKNIFFFFRTLKNKDLRLINEIIKNEADNLEINLDIFYQWLTMGDRCPDPEEIRPSWDTLYHYAGFFINTIGGRSYLFRRPTNLRLIFQYYCLLIIHEMDKTGKNRYGIDIIPQIAPLMKEMGSNSDLQFQNEYLNQLIIIRNYYKERQ